MKWLLLIVLLIVVLVAVALWRRTQMTGGAPADADPASVAAGQTLVPPPVPPAAGIPPVFDPLVPVVPVDPVEPHEAVLPYDATPAPAETVDEPGDSSQPGSSQPSSSQPDSSRPDSGSAPPVGDGR